MLNGTVQIVSAPPTAKVGDWFQATFLVANTGSVAFIPGQMRIGTLDNDPTWTTQRVELPLLQPGQSAQVSQYFKPTRGGSLSFSVKLLQENVIWFGPVASVSIAVEGPPTPQLGKRTDPADLVGKELINTGAVIAIGPTLQQLEFRNDGPLAMLIKQATLWTGVDFGGRCDSHCEVIRSDGSTMMVLDCDCYADPSLPRIEKATFDPYFLLAPTERLILGWWANPFSGPGLHVHHVLRALWQWRQ